MPNLEANNLLAKYLFKKNEMRPNGRPKPWAIKPRAGDMLSLSEVTDLPHQAICAHGHEYVDNPEKSRVHIGYVKLFQSSLSHLGLESIYDNDPPRHVSVKFPDNIEKRREMSKALSHKVVVINIDSSKKYFAPCE